MNKIGPVTLENGQAGETLLLSNPLGYKSLERLTVGFLVGGLAWVVAAIFILPSKWIGAGAIPVPALFFVYLSLASFLNRTRVEVSSAGIRLRTQPIPVPGYPFRRSLSAERIAAIFVNPFAIPNRYSATFIHSFDVLVLTTEGEPVTLLTRIRKKEEALELAGMIRGALGRTPVSPAPLLDTPSRRICLPDELFPNGWPSVFFFAGLFIAGVLIFTSPWIFTTNKTPVVATVTEVGTKWVSGAKSSYRKQLCYIRYDTAEGRQDTVLEEDCPRSARKGTTVVVYYDPAVPDHAVVRSFWKWPFGLIYCLLGLGGLGYQAWIRQQPKLSLMEDRFRSLDCFWDLSSKNATVAEGRLELKGQPREVFAPLLHRMVLSSPTVEVQVRAPDIGALAGIKFWADGVGSSYVFAVLQAQRLAQCWRVGTDGRTEWILQPVCVQLSGEEWTALRVVTRGNQAELFVDGRQAATIPGQAPPGGSLAGVFAEFAANPSAAGCAFSNFRVT